MKNSTFTLFAVLTSLLANPFVLLAANLESGDSGKPSYTLFDHSLIVSSDRAPVEKEENALQAALEVIRREGPTAGTALLEDFLRRFPSNRWNLSIRVHLAGYYREHGSYSLALHHWETAWEQGRNSTNGAAKELADYTLVKWTRLLASLGRADQLQKLFSETANRTLDGGPLQQAFLKTQEGYSMMRSRPGIAYKCGTYALTAVGNLLTTNRFGREFTAIPSPETGFSLGTLSELALKAGLPLSAVKRTNSTTVLVPSIVHWKQDHFAAITRQRGALYYVTDPTFEYPLWLTAEEINSEASGYFMVCSTNVGTSFLTLGEGEAAGVFGKGFPFSFTDYSDLSCTPDPSNPDACPACRPGERGGSGPGGSGPPLGTRSQFWRGSLATDTPFTGSCNDCGGGGGAGMPIWQVSEPYINLWVEDEPLVYHSHQGPQVRFRLSYKQRDEVERSTNVFSFGKMWNAGLLSYLDDNNPANNTYTNVILYNPGGGRVTYSAGNLLDGISNTRLERMNDDPNSGFWIHYSSGAVDEYNFVILGTSVNRIYLSARKGSEGHAVQFIYATNGNPIIVRLLYIVDAQGLTNTIAYATNHSYSSNLISGIIDPYGRSAAFAYDSTGHLTNITDALGISSGFSYDNLGWLTNLATPYGTTSFRLANHWAGGESPLSRSATITYPDGSKELYLYRDEWTTLIDAITNDFPTSASMPTDARDLLMEFSDSWRQYRNSARWNRYQYTYLSAETKSDIANLNSNEVRIARLRHWFNGPNPMTDENVTSALSFERAPAAHMSASEIPTPVWYGWKRFDDGDGGDGNLDMSHAAVVAVRLPNGATRFSWKQFNFAGNMTNFTEAYGPEDDVELRTRRSVYDSNGTDLKMEFNFSGGMVLTNVFSGNLLTYSYNAQMETTSYAYDGNSRLTSITRPGGLTVGFTYTNGYLRTRVEYGDSFNNAATNTYTYTNGMVFTHTDPRGLTVTNRYDNLDRLVSTHFPDGTYTSNRYTLLDVTGTRDRLGNWNYFAYDSLRRLVAATNANGPTTFGYCECGSVSSVTNVLNEVTEHFHDLAGRLVSTHFADGTWVTNLYDRANQLDVILQSNGNAVTNFYNTHGLRDAVSNRIGRLQAFAYNIEDRVSSATDANGITVTSSYDNLGQLTQRSYPDGGSETFGYWAGVLTNHTDQLGQVTRYAYDEAGRKTAETNANNEFTLYSYNSAGDLLSLTDGKGQTTLWNYDQYGRVTNKVDTLGSTMFRYDYDANGRLTNRWSPEKGTTGYTYDTMGNLTNVDYPNSTDLRMKYDALNRLTNMVDAVGTNRFTYATNGAVALEDGPWSDDTVSFSYTNGFLSAVSVAQPQSFGASWQQNYGYDAGGRLKTVSSPAGTFTYNYWRVGSLFTNLALPNGATISNAFDSVGRTLATVLKNSAGVALDSYGYLYNSGGQRTNITRTAGDWTRYQYDAVGQLTAATGYKSGGSADFDDYTYAYDAAHNLTNLGVMGGFPQWFRVNSLNQLTNVETPEDIFRLTGYTTAPVTNVTVNVSGTDFAAELYSENRFGVADFQEPTPGDADTITATAKDAHGRTANTALNVMWPGTNGFAYDLNGNLTNSAGRALEYDDENQLTCITQTNAWKSEFAYDGKMRRRIRKEYVWHNDAFQPVAEVRYLYDGNLVVQEQHYDLRIPLSLPVSLVTYTRGNDLNGSMEGAGGIGGLLARSEQSTFHSESSTAYYHSDANGNVTAIVDTNQSIVARYTYGPFGSLEAMSGPLAEANLYRFSSKEFHVASGLVYYLYRYYESQLQRWVNRDPISEEGGANLFGFVLNNALSYYDPYGLDWLPPTAPPGPIDIPGRWPPQTPPRIPPFDIPRPTPRPPPSVPRPPPTIPIWTRIVGPCLSLVFLTGHESPEREKYRKDNRECWEEAKKALDESRRQGFPITENDSVRIYRRCMKNRGHSLPGTDPTDP